MAIKQRLLKSIRYAMDLLETCDTVVLPKVVASLEDAGSLLQVGLPSDYRAQYKEIIDGVGSSLHHANINELQEVFLLSKDLLIFAEKQIRKETHFKRELVFLPYSASMWDSMESVWQAADADKDHAIAYVVPIPYFDRNPDGSIKEWHCDAGKFPHYVPIRDYRSVDLEEMHPDVIVIHSPYDDTNIVTSVRPDYYSRNLKSYTDKLVYIPYFVLEEVDPKDGEALGSISHFVLTPGVYNADVTVVQSENMRKAYVEILTQLSKVEDRSYWEKRILGLGSPKIDKVLSTKRENIKLPESWQRIIEKPDGARKKVIFYNVSLASLLEHEDKLLDKMEWVFGVFRKRQDEVALLWRPHPLFVPTLESMKPELLARYRDMVDRYKREGWGIYDDTSELHRSIAISDGYYGDGSSLVTMFRGAGKPVVLATVESYGWSGNDARCIHFRNFCRIDNFLFFSASNTNGFYKYDLYSECAKLIDFFPREKNSYVLYSKILRHQSRFYFFPYCGNYIQVYNMLSHKWLSINLGESHISISECRFINAYLDGQDVWLIPCKAQAIVKFNLLTHEISYYTDWIANAILGDDNDSEYLFGDGMLIDGKIWFLSLSGQRVYCFDTQSKCCKRYDVSDSMESCTSIAFDGESFWLYARSGDLILWQPGTGVTGRKENIFLDHCSFAALRYVDGKVWVIAAERDNYAVVDVASGHIELHLHYLHGQEYCGFPLLDLQGQYLYLCPDKCDFIIAIDTMTKTVRLMRSHEASDSYEKRLQFSLATMIQNGNVVHEAKRSDWLALLCDASLGQSKIKQRPTKCMGATMYGYIKSQAQ